MTLVYNLDFINDKSKKSNIKRAISILEQAYYKQIEVSSFFLDPFERRVIGSIAEKNGIKIKFVGANPRAERKIFIANPYYDDIDTSQYIRVMEFEKVEIGHPDILGALIHLGLDRNKIGDISILEEKVEFVLLKEDAAFVKYNLFKVKREPIAIDFKDTNMLDLIEAKYIEKSGFISSLRLDNLIGLMVNSSRKKAKDLISKSLVKVDFQTITDPSYKVSESSPISIRGWGRFIFDGVSGRSKKDNYHVDYRKLI
ncbi:MAG: YlmH/Sll1252 family protein [Anaerococcus sp.]|nr:YlmH/Sll1252 family protein [Anaerococcus sp.]